MKQEQEEEKLYTEDITKGLYLSIDNTDIESFKYYFYHKQYKVMKSNYFIFKTALRRAYIPIIKLILEDERTDPVQDNNFALVISADHNLIDIMELLLKDKRILPEFNDNIAIWVADQKGNNDAIILLWNEQSVKKSLKNDYNELYRKLFVLDVKEKIIIF